MKKTLVMCPLNKENQFLREGLENLGFPAVLEKAGNSNLYNIPSLNLLIATGGHGKVQFAIQTQFFLSTISGIDRVFCIGAGGALEAGISIGDLVVAEKTIEHDYMEKFKKPAKKPEIPGCPKLLSLAKELANTDFVIHFGPIASGDEDIIDASRADQLRMDTQALAVAWEGIGAAKACRLNKVPFIEIRAITDDCRNAVLDSFIKNLPLAMQNAAILVSKLTSQTLLG